MKAFIMECDAFGKQLRLGTFSNFVSNEYQHLANLKKFAFKGARPGMYRIEAFVDWGNRYGTPDIISFHTVVGAE